MGLSGIEEDMADTIGNSGGAVRGAGLPIMGIGKLCRQFDALWRERCFGRLPEPNGLARGAL